MKFSEKIYFALNPDVDPTTGVKVSTLISGKYFNETSKTNRLKTGVYVKIKDGAYVYDGTCKN